MNTVQLVICSALFVGVSSSADFAAAQSAAEWSCEIGECELIVAAPRETSSALSCVTEQRNFFIEKITNASAGARSGTFNFVGQLVSNDPETRSLDNYHKTSKERAYLKDMVISLHAPDSVADVTVTLSDATGNPLGTRIKDGANNTMVFWSHDVESSSSVGQKIQLEIQGIAVANSDGKGDLEAPRLWLNVYGTRCDTL